MFQFFELQLWEVLPVISLKEMMEEMTEVSPQDMKLYLKNGTILDDNKLLRDYGINADVHTVGNPAELFVGYRVDLDELTEDEAEDEEEAENALDVSPDFEYFETVSDIDFTNEILRDRDFDEEEEDVSYDPKVHKVIQVPMRFTGDPIPPVGYNLKDMKKIRGGLKDVGEEQKNVDTTCG
ncbi:hypothetical protein RvY_06106-1 [Ramazzottius varieornatus]|uniref:Ubiquitin-like domain-containing protein n=1 Tax=Ramazzottius varieornatus TaxID=947166 RepID=A0A1D1V0F1_RAMVA|nr:hypothetical protein RvY_06106-1 [Ramazzottius varieornatus]